MLALLHLHVGDQATAVSQHKQSLYTRQRCVGPLKLFQSMSGFNA